MDNTNKKYPEYKQFFRTATDNYPYPYQEKFATEGCLPNLIDAPTGSGKTAAIILGWLWRRRFHRDDSIRQKTPRRLVYCLPLRTLVEQTKDNAIKWLNKLKLLGGTATIEDNKVKSYEPSWNDTNTDTICVTVLMGGEDRDEWDLYPERDAIIIGTQDMLLSRALNRGYGMSRYKWPIHFGLLNNDCLWVMDEMQLMGVGVETTSQMEAFRSNSSIGTMFPSSSVWMSATISSKQLDTVDNKQSTPHSLLLSSDDYANSNLGKIYVAKKEIKKTDSVVLNKNNEDKYAKEVAKLILSNHKKNTLSLCIVNTVKRAQNIYTELLKSGRNHDNTAVLHSRFRAGDRSEKIRILEQEGDRIVISTQVVEAGVDVSSRTLITELAPWSSLVQRFGRCNRRGEYEDSKIIWIDMQPINEDLSSPYDVESIEKSRNIISGISNASPKDLKGIVYDPPELIRPVIRKKDNVDLFDTTPDLTGNDLDVSRFIRDEQDKDVQVYWKDLEGNSPDEKIEEPSKEELCSVSISEIRKYVKVYHDSSWIWDALDGKWVNVESGGRNIRPGQILLLDSKNGGYTEDLGWIGVNKDVKPVDVIQKKGSTKDLQRGMEDDNDSFRGVWVPLTDHLIHIKDEIRVICGKLNCNKYDTIILEQSAEFHDIGKAHLAFQNMIKSSLTFRNQSPDTLWAKSDVISGKPNYYVDDSKRPYFRHELASALAWLGYSKSKNDNENEFKDEEINLIAYLIASHHGKIRLSIRSLPQEVIPGDGRLIARGVWDQDWIPAVDSILPEGLHLDLSIMQLGDGSWLDRMISLRDSKKFGIFRLAMLESLLRIADIRGSKKEADSHNK